jgi:hypothetical protein
MLKNIQKIKKGSLKTDFLLKTKIFSGIIKWKYVFPLEVMTAKEQQVAQYFIVYRKLRPEEPTRVTPPVGFREQRGYAGTRECWERPVDAVSEHQRVGGG